jgi:phage FluMu gp28-like protein
MGWYVIMEPFTDKKEKGTTIGQMCLDAFSEDWEELEIAHMATSDEFRIELFSFHRGIDNSF